MWRAVLNGAIRGLAGPGERTAVIVPCTVVAASETWTETEGWGRKVREWTQLPTKPDNHWLDCLAGCAVAASMCGIQLPGEASPRRQRKKYTQEDLRR